jgi:hypothetical protein
VTTGAGRVDPADHDWLCCTSGADRRTVTFLRLRWPLLAGGAGVQQTR